MKRQKIAPELKEQIINRIKNEGVTVMQAAKDHGLAEGTIYTWIARKVDGGPTQSEIIKLKRENDQLKILLGEITLKLSETQKKKC
jgi:transposase-like protein